MRTYDVALVLKTTLSEADRKKVLQSVKDILKGTKIAKEDDWGEKALAYQIKRQTTGAYFVLSVEGESIPSDFEKKLFANENIIRHLVVRTK